MEVSVFQDKKITPDEKSLSQAIGSTFPIWKTIREYVSSKYPAIIKEWSYPGPKYGWSFRMKDKKRTIIYFLPRDQFFKVAFVFSQQATEKVLESTISDTIKNELKSAKVFAEGRGIRIEVRKKNSIADIKSLIDIKLSS